VIFLELDESLEDDFRWKIGAVRERPSRQGKEREKGNTRQVAAQGKIPCGSSQKTATRSGRRSRFGAVRAAAAGTCTGRK
jgi:hypothetical protein